MVSTKIVNKTGGKLSLKEGNAGVYRDIKDLEKDMTHTIEIDPNATYREYVVVSTPSGNKVFVTSDDCIDNSEITIVVKDGKYVFEGKLRVKNPVDPAAPGNFFSRMLNRVWPGRR